MEHGQHEKSKGKMRDLGKSSEYGPVSPAYVGERTPKKHYHRMSFTDEQMPEMGKMDVGKMMPMKLSMMMMGKRKREDGKMEYEVEMREGMMGE